jgi:hypothetical protein
MRNLTNEEKKQLTNSIIKLERFAYVRAELVSELSEKIKMFGDDHLTEQAEDLVLNVTDQYLNDYDYIGTISHNGEKMHVYEYYK